VSSIPLLRNLISLLLQIDTHRYGTTTTSNGSHIPLPPSESGIDSGSEEPKGREKYKSAPIHNDSSREQ
jgi:hypothetical protein